MTKRDLEAQIPRLKTADYSVTSERTPKYNCFAWAVGDTTRVWAPVPVGSGNYWPPGIPQWDTLGAYRALYEQEGFSVCADDAHEPAYERIAIFADARTGEPTHAARQLSDGRWTSKLGSDVDIAHADLDAVGGDEKMSYGEVVLLMKRPLPDDPSPEGVGDGLRVLVNEASSAIARALGRKH